MTRSSGPSSKPATQRPSAGSSGLVAVLGLLAVLMLMPFVVVALNAVKTPQEYGANGPLALPHGISLAGLREFWERVGFGQKLLNSLLISTGVAIGAVLLSLFNAFALGVGRVRGRTWLLILFISAATLPQEALVYPLYYLAKQVDLYDTRISVVIVFTVLQSAFGTYLLASVLGQFPAEILDAARIDGVNSWQLLWRVVVPISRPTLGVLVVFFFIWTWNEFFLPLVLLISNDNQTVSVALGVLQGQRLMDATMTNASALLGVLPAIVFFLIFSRTLTRGVTVGAVK